MVNRTYHPRGRLVDGKPIREHPLYATWSNMMSRCYNPKDPSFINYGARGITVCERWWHVANFIEDMGQKPSLNMSLERQNNDRGYSPDNCVWATRSEQCVNRRLFKNNVSGVAGVKARAHRFHAVFDFERVRYDIGYFDTVEAAQRARDEFVRTFFVDRDAAVRAISGERVRYDSSTGIRGVTRHPDGGYVVRATQNGKRVYLGYFKTIEEAKHARQNSTAG